jgi:hypothetical protein
MAFNWDKITQDSKQFIKTPLAIIMLLVLMALAWSTRLLIKAKDDELHNQELRIQDCDGERKADKKLMQEILFEQRLNDKLKNNGN